MACEAGRRGGQSRGWGRGSSGTGRKRAYRDARATAGRQKTGILSRGGRPERERAWMTSMSAAAKGRDKKKEVEKVIAQ